MENNTDIKILLGKRIKELRTKRGLTQEKLSEIVGVGQRNLSKIECGKTFLTSDTLSKLLIALEVEAKELFDFKFSKEKETLKEELLNAITNEQVDIDLMYRFYCSIK